jgi:hypothetical protein
MFKRFSVPLLILSLVLGFQNCEEQKWSSSSASSYSSGNGQSYGGKPIGLYINVDLNHSCDGQAGGVYGVRAVIEFNEDSSRGTLVTDNCQASEGQSIELNEVGFSRSNTDVLTWRGRLYQKFAMLPPELLSDNDVVIMMCRGEGDGANLTEDGQIQHLISDVVIYGSAAGAKTYLQIGYFDKFSGALLSSVTSTKFELSAADDGTRTSFLISNLAEGGTNPLQPAYLNLSFLNTASNSTGVSAADLSFGFIPRPEYPSGRQYTMSSTFCYRP